MDTEKGECCSQKNYQTEFVQTEKMWHYTKVLVAMVSTIIIPAAILGGMLPSLTTGLYCDQQPNIDAAVDCSLIIGFTSIGLAGIIFLLGILTTVHAAKTTPHIWSNDGDDRPVGLVQALRERRATVPADKAFALHGVLNSIGISATTPDYSRSLGEVYHGLFLDLLRHKTSLINLLLDVGPRLPGVPSWVPDWSSLHERGWIDSKKMYSGGDLHGASYAEPQMKVTDQSLGLWSIAKDTVAFRSGSFQELAPNSRESSEVTATFDHMIRTFAEWVRAIGQTMSTPIDCGGPDTVKNVYGALMGREVTPDPDDLEVFKRWLCAMQHQPTRELAPGVLQAIAAILYNDPPILEFTISCCNALTGRRVLFVTLERQIGSGPVDLAVGDPLVLLRGVFMPMVLRRAGNRPDTFEVIGPAFVGPLMNMSEFQSSDCGRDWESLYLI